MQRTPNVCFWVIVMELKPIGCVCKIIFFYIKERRGMNEG